MTFLSYDIYFEMRLCFVCLLCTNFAFLTSAESGYSIKLKQGKRESYLWMEFPLVNESIFPRNLKLNLSVDNYVGLLLYSIDTNKNQLVVTMSGTAMNLLVQVMGGNQEQISLKRLCGCKPCLYIHLLLEMGMRNSTFWVKCNGGSESVVTFNWSNRTLAEGYPTLKHKQGNRSSSANSADLYFIDYPNNKDSQQMQGCIFDIEYNGQSIINNMSIFGKGITEGCRKTCSSKICNGGVCLDTYVREPICNCTTVFGSGKNCTDVSRKVNSRYNQTFAKFVGIKLSWRSSGIILWQMGNKQLTVTVTVDYSERLVLILTDSQRNHVGKETLLADYIRNESYVLILRPYKTIPHKKVNNVTVIYANCSGLKYEDVNIDYMILSSCGGVIDVAVLEKEDAIQWNPLELKAKDSSPHNCIDTKESGTQSQRIYSPVVAISSSLIVAALIIGCMLYKQWIKRTNKPNNIELEAREQLLENQPQSTNAEMEVRKRQSHAKTNNDRDNLIRSSPIHIAAGKGDFEKVKSLMKEGADVKAVDDKGQTTLHYAAINGHLKVVKYLNENGTGVHVVNKNKETALHLAARYGHLDVVKYLVDLGAKVYAVDANNATPLHFAANAGRLNVVTYLIGRGAKVNAVENSNNTPLHFAARNGHLKVVKYLNENGTGVDVVNKHNETPLHLAARYGHLDVVKYLVDLGAKVYAVDANNATPLHFAANAGRLNVVTYLIGRGAKVNAVENSNNTPLHFAASNGHLEVVTYLNKNGTGVDVLNKHNETPLHLAARYGHLDVVKYLVHLCAKVDAVDANNQTALHFAVIYGHLDVLKYLHQKGADVNAADKNNQTPLHLAVENNKSDVLEYLVPVCDKIDAQDNNMQTALHLAAKNGNEDVVMSLTLNDANVNIEDANKQMALHLAARNGYLAIVNFLHKNGAYVNAVDHKNRTPLHCAKENNHMSVVNYLTDNK